MDDRIKKRMSMRHADISAPTNASVPPMPAMPVGVRSEFGGGMREGLSEEGVRREPRDKEDPRVVERRMLDKDDFDADACESFAIHLSVMWNLQRYRFEGETGQLDGI